jgi:hypothetical protein
LHIGAGGRTCLPTRFVAAVRALAPTAPGIPACSAARFLTAAARPRRAAAGSGKVAANARAWIATAISTRRAGRRVTALGS